jgi:hypothetical protein
VEVVSVLPSKGESPSLAKLPENDRPILWAAITVRATHLLSGDFKAFGRFYGQTIQGVAIMPPAEYLKKHRGKLYPRSSSTLAAAFSSEDPVDDTTTLLP